MIARHRLLISWVLLSLGPLGPWSVGCQPISTLLKNGSGRSSAPSARQTESEKMRISAGVELELTPDANFWKLMGTETDRVGDLLAALGQNVLGSAHSYVRELGLRAEAPFSQLDPKKKNEVVGKLAGLRPNYIFALPGGRKIPALRFRDSFPLERNEVRGSPNWMTQLGLVSQGRFQLTGFFLPEIEYGNEESASGNFTLAEVHVQNAGISRAGDLYARATEVAEMLQLDVRSVHVHAVAPSPFVTLNQSRLSELRQALIPFSGLVLQVLRLAEYYRRLNLWMDMFSFVEADVSIRRNPPHYDLLTDDQYARLLEALVDGSEKAKKSRIFASVAFQFPGKYSEAELAGLEFRGFWKTQDVAMIKRRLNMLNLLHEQFASQDFAVDGGQLRAWLLAQRKLSPGVDVKVLLARQAHGLYLARAEAMAIAKGWTEIAAWLGRMTPKDFDDRAGIALVLHDWSNDPWFAHDPSLQSQVEKHRTVALQKLPKFEQHFEIVRDFLVDSGLYAAVLQSLRLPALE